MNQSKLHLGIDLGSISLKVILIDDSERIIFERWTRVSGDPLNSMGKALSDLKAEVGHLTIAGVGVTGSGRALIAKACNAREINEISAHSAASKHLNPDIRSIIEIGGQDSKLVILNDQGTIKTFRMNELCAAGTGAFLDQQAARLNLSISEFAKLADDATDPVPIAGRCAVFAKTDMTHHQQEGRPLSDIVAGLNEALVRSYLSNLVRGIDLPKPIAFQGGVASNAGLADAFRRILNLKGGDLVIPKNHLTMGAIGAAIIAKNSPAPKESNVSSLIDRISSHTAQNSDQQHNYSNTLKGRKRNDLVPNFKELNLLENYLGIDIGSVSVKIALISPVGLIHSDYRFSDGKPLELLKSMLASMNSRFPELTIGGAGITGSGRNFIGKILSCNAIINEITAQVRAVNFISPKTDTIVEIGGQDAKFMRVENGHASHFQMNKVCAAGTGAFLQEQSDRLKIDLKNDFAKLAFDSKRPAGLGTRCTVFMESDIVSHQQMGYSKSDLVAGLSHSVVTNYLEKVVSGAPVGDNILFLGGVAENDAVVSALESQLEKRVHTSIVGKLSGAIGAALTAWDRKSAGEYSKSNFKTKPDSTKISQFRCDDCPNTCLITHAHDADRTSQIAIGGRCGKWETSIQKTNKISKSLIKQRNELLGVKTHNPTSKPRGLLRIGIPLALLAYDRLPAWRTFFEEIGCEVIVSPPTDSAMLGEGTKRLAVETCLPIKAFCSHIHWLQTNADIDYLFVPSIIYHSTDLHNRDTSHCPYVQAARQFADNVATMPILNPVISWKWHPKDEELQMIAMADELGVSRKKAKAAWQKAYNAQVEFKKKLISMGDEVLSDLESGKLDKVFLLLGKDYNVCDPRLNSDIVRIFESFGETLITQDMIVDDSGNYSPAFKSMLWAHGKEILAASEVASTTNKLYPVMITNFGCGPDSFTTKFAELSAGNKPFLTLEVDEHSSPVGMETRIEAFLDSLSKHKDDAPQRPVQSVVIKNGIKKVYLPNFSDHGYAFAATFKALGFEPHLTSLPDDESMRLGSKHSTSGECHPYTLMLGDYIKTAKLDHDFSDAFYFMPDSGLCRVGQFGATMNIVAEKEKLNLPIYTSIEDILLANPRSKGSSRINAVTIYWKMMRGMDFLSQKFFETRAYEVNAGEADRAHDEINSSMMNYIHDGKALDGLKHAISLLDDVKVDRSTSKVKIGITGDYYTRICDYANSDIFRDIERLGGVVMLPPTMCEFAKYDTYQKTTWAINHRQPKKFVQNMLGRHVVNRDEVKIRSLFGDGIDYEIPLEYRESMKYLKPYMSEKLPSGLTSSVNAILDQIRSGADGILNLITFHCTYGLVISSVLSSIDKDYPDLPKLTLIFEGIKPNHNKLRLEAFMERMLSNSKSQLPKL